MSKFNPTNQAARPPDPTLHKAAKRLEAYKKLKDEVGAPVSIGIDTANAEDISIVVIRSDRALPVEMINRISTDMKNAFANAKIIVVDGGMSLELFKGRRTDG